LTTIPKPAVHFRDIAIRAVQTFPHSCSERRYVPDTMAGGGTALFIMWPDGRLVRGPFLSAASIRAISQRSNAAKGFFLSLFKPFIASNQIRLCT
jgi:hypothetical protein